MSTAGRLLVASPGLTDGTFDRTVVLVLEHSAEGALGVVLNQPSDLPVGSLLPDWADAASEPALVFTGGPVSPDAALGLVRTERTDLLGARRLAHGATLIDLDTPAALVGQAVSAMRVFAGYAGWSPGQLDSEVDEGAWFVVDTLPDDVFSDKPHDLWRRVLRRQPHPLSLVSSFPRDPALN